MKKTITSLLLMLLVVVSAWGQTSNKCGEDAYWKLNGTTLNITGSGAMWNYDNVECLAISHLAALSFITLS